MPVVDGEPGRAFDLRDRAVDVDEVATALRGGPDDAGDASADGSITVRCPSPGPVHRRVGVVRPDRSYPLQAALAAAARSRGHEASVADELADVRRRLEAIDPPAVSLADERRHVASADAPDGLEERLASLRGQLEIARERGEDAEDLAAARERAVADLAERRTTRIAAEQRLERARSAARDARDRREERLRLEDRERNLERRARRDLAERMQAAFERAIDALPGEASAGEPPGRVVGPDADGALAVCRLARLQAPVVVAVDRFQTAEAAAAALDAPVLLVDG